MTDRANLAPDGFPARAEDWISGGGEACTVRERLRDAAGLSDEYVEVARHTTVRVSPGRRADDRNNGTLPAFQ
ncbi:hypothetical protein [Methanoculleus chikugoensis]|uniref:hypothetical protein n=1 Tax=Methanoculleus chikugoensis TaxID=118126 RepID=UPI001FB463E3|nr:hypothetical protein [Methanoculleus chikugoensis]